jgi:hypothetical protein
MGFFSSIKNNLTGGGVKVQIDAPASASLQDAALPLTVTLTSDKESKNVTSIVVTLVAEDQSYGYRQPSEAGTNTPINRQDVARIEYNQPIQLVAGQPQQIPLQLTLNSGKAAEEANAAENPQLTAAAGMIKKIQDVSNALNKNKYEYFIEATADVEGVAFDPNDRKPIQLLKPGEFGGGLNLHI